jgi:O-antigen ligase
VTASAATSPAHVSAPSHASAFAAATGLGAAALVGGACLLSPLYGVGIAAGLLLVAVAARDLAVALALWLPTLFLEGVPALNLAGKAGGLVLLAAWAWEVRRDGAAFAAVRRECPGTLFLLFGLLTWTTLSVGWAENWQSAFSGLLRWYAVGLLFLVTACTVRSPVALRRLALAFVVGGVLSVLVSVASGSTATGGGAARLATAAGDPNFLGAWLLAAAVVALTLCVVLVGGATRAFLVGSLCLLLVGMGLTVSRGAFIAAAMTGIAGLVLLQGRRRPVLALTLTGTVGVVVWLQSSPAALRRFSDTSTGSGRSDLWAVAWKMTRHHPWLGVGLDNFTDQAGVYMREVGPITTSYLIARAQPDEVHNVYLQTLAEGGVVALVLLVGFAYACLRATVQAARRLDAQGLGKEATLVYGLLLAQCSLLAASFFLSSAVDKRLWLLLALGPALSVLSRSGVRPRP